MAARVKEWAALAGIGAVFILLYWVTQAPLYNPTGWVDPWLYTALFTNFDWAYHAFWDTYYAARLPWVLPGYALNSALSAHLAYFVLHTSFFFGGALSAYYLLRRYVGRLGAFVGYGFLLGTQLYYLAQTWNYVDGAVITYLLGGLCLTLTRATGRRRTLAIAIGGSLTAAAVLTNILVVVFAVGIPLLYLWLNRSSRTALSVTNDAAAFAVGAVGLTLICGVFAVMKGGALLFWRPQLHAASHLVGSKEFGVHTWGWIGSEGRLLAPLFLGLAACLLCAAERAHRDLVWQFTLGSAVYALACEGFFLLWDLAFSGTTLQWPYSFSLLLPATAMCLGGAVALLLRRLPLTRDRLLVATLTLAAVSVPLLVIYLGDDPTLTGRTGTYVTLGLAAAAWTAIVLTIAWRSAKGRRVLATLAAALFVVTPSFAIDSSADVFRYARTDSSRGDVYDLGLKLVVYMRATGIQSDRPFFFWYRGYDRGIANSLVGLQSLYFYANTFVGTRMPHIDDGTRSRLRRLPHGSHLVLLCRASRCDGGPAVLRRGRYSLTPVRTDLLAAGAERLWIHVFTFNGIRARS